MTLSAAAADSASAPTQHRELLHADPGVLGGWLSDRRRTRSLVFCLLAVALGFGAYGYSVGVWRSPAMGFYVALKLPLLILLTLGLNVLLNTLLGLLLGSGLGLRDTLLCQLMSFAVAGIILGSLSPITLLMALDAPRPDSPEATTAHSINLVVHTALIGAAGFAANRHLFRLLCALVPDPLIARRALLGWLAGNAFLGAQLSWILRPFFGSPSLKVAFLRGDPFQGTFYEAVWAALTRIAGTGGALLCLAVGATTIVLLLKLTFSPPIQNQRP